MRAWNGLVLGCAMTLAACGGNSPEPASPADGEPAGDEAAMGADEGAEEAPAEESAPVEEDSTASEADSDAAESEEEAAGEEEAAPSDYQEPAPSSDLQAYMGSAPATPEYKTVQENMEKFKFCYLDAMRSDPDLQGEIRVRFTVNKAGKVPKVKVMKNELNADVETCVIKVFKKLKFPKRNSKRTVEYPFKFIPAP